MRGLRRVSLLALALVLGCGSPREFRCDEDDQCALGDVSGRCEESGYCSLPDDECDGDYRYVEQSPPDLAGSCVGGEGASDEDAGIPVSDADPEAPVGCATALAAGGRHTCAATSGGTVYCWGDNASQQLGSDRDSAAPGPVELPDVRVVELAAGDAHTCALESREDGEGRVFCWGSNEWGQLGLGYIVDQSLPEGALNVNDIVTLGLGNTHSCTVDSLDAVHCWGDNRVDQVDNERLEDAVLAEQLALFLESATGVAGGRGHTVTVTEDGAVFTWGAADTSPLGRGSPAESSPGEITEGAFPARAVTAGDLHTCGVSQDGSVFCWGLGGNGQLGFDGDEAFAPTEVPGLVEVDQVQAGGRHTCARSGTALSCFGDNGAGQLGVDGAGGPEPRAVPGAWVDVVAGDAHTCARSSTDAIYCWGDNGAGQLGDDGDPRSEPRVVELPCD